MSRQAIDKRRRASTLLAVRQGSDWHYPACQFGQGEVISGIADIVRHMAASGPWVTLDFLLSADTALGNRTPLQALQDGDREDVLRLVLANQTDGFARTLRLLVVRRVKPLHHRHCSQASPCRWTGLKQASYCTGFTGLTLRRYFSAPAPAIRQPIASTVPAGGSGYYMPA